MHQLPELLDYDSVSVLLGISKRTLQDIADFRLRGVKPQC